MWPFNRNSAAEIRSSEPYWLMRNGIGAASPALQGSIDCDVLIIGAGITGALVADALIATGLRIVVLDERDIAQGSTSASTALLQYEIDTSLTELTGLLGAKAAMQAYTACAQSFAMLEGRMPELLPLADYERRESVYLARKESDVEPMQAELAARRAIGLKVQWLGADEVRQRFGCRRPGGILSALGGQVDPFRLARALFSSSARHGVRMFARSKVEAIEEAGEGLRVRVAGRHVVSAAHVVVCAGYESLKFLPEKVADLHNTFALVTEPLNPIERATRMPLIWERAEPYIYVRSTADGRLILGGEDLPFKSAIARDAVLPRQIRRLTEKYEELFGEALPPIAYTWGGTFAETEDGLPYIGPVPGMHPRLQFALCYGGNGITYSVQAGDMIRAHVEGRRHELAGVFGFERKSGAGKGFPGEKNGDIPRFPAERAKGDVPL